MTATYTLETGVPVPLKRGGVAGSAVRALTTAPAGASVFVPSACFEGKKTPPSTAVSQICASYGRGWFVVRKVDGGVRAWKVANPPKAPLSFAA